MIVWLGEERIQAAIEDPGVRKKGATIARNDNVVKINHQGEWVFGKVKLSNLYHEPKVRIAGDLDVAEFGCTCSLSQVAVCHHVAALLYALRYDVPEPIYKNRYYSVFERYVVDYDRQHEMAENKEPQKRQNPFKNFGQNIGSHGVKIPLSFTADLSVSHHSYREDDEISMEVAFKLGVVKLYSLKNYADFFKALHEERTLNYGKSFTLDGRIHEIPTAYRPLFRFIESVSTLSDLLTSQYYYRNNSLIQRNKVILTEDLLIEQLLELLGTMPLTIEVHSTQGSRKVFFAEKIILEPIQLPLEFKSKQKDGKKYYELCIPGDWPIPMTRNYDYVLYDGAVRRLDQTQAQLLQELIFMRRKEGRALVEPEDAEEFVRHAYPKIKKLGQVSFPPVLAKKITEAPLKARFYFDHHEGGGIQVRVEFAYEDQIVNPLDKGTPSEQWIIRDLLKEGDLLANFQDFEPVEGSYVLTEPDKLFRFSTEILPRLPELAEVFYAKDFKPIQYKFKKVKSSLSLGAQAYMEVSFDTGDLDKKELARIFKALRQKKQYYRLKNGSFLDLGDQDLKDFQALVEDLDLDDADLGKKLLQLPMNRALYVEELLKDRDDGYIDRSSEYRQFVKTIQRPQERDFQLPEAYEGVLRSYQKQGYQWLKALDHYKLSGILADDMGLGKTLQTIAFIDSAYKNTGLPTLIVAPTSLIYNWEDEVKKFAPWLSVLVISGTKEERNMLLSDYGTYAIIVTSYPLIRRDIELYEEMRYAYCIIDEAQNIKNPSSQTALCVKRIKAGGRFALTGTPIENNLTELWSIFDFIMPGYLQNQHKFAGEYEKPINNGDGRVLEKLKKQIRPFLLRRLKKDVLTELPPKIETKSLAHMGDEQKQVYLAYLEKIKEELEGDLAGDGYQRSQIKILSYLTRLRQICCHPATFLDNYAGGSGKLDLLKEILQDALEAGHKVLLFSQFTSMLAIIRQMLEADGISYAYLDGSVKAQTRKALVHDFNEGDKQVFLISLKAGGTGLNLTGADVVIHFDPWWNPAVEDQATDRAYRIGQKNTVQVFKLIAQGTIEDKIYELQQKKKNMINSVIEPGETLFNKLSEQEIRGLFGM